MSSECQKPIKARLIQVTALDVCGNEITGSGHQLFRTDGFIKVEAKPEYDAGQEFEEKNANGDLCVNEKDPDRLKRIKLGIDLCTVDPELIVAITGQTPLLNAGIVTGVCFAENPLPVRFRLELWQPLAGSACGGTVERFLYWVWGNIGNGTVGDHTFENGVFQYHLDAETKRDSGGFHYCHNFASGLPGAPGCGDLA